MTDSEKIEFTTTAFQCLINDQRDRLRRGAIQRQAVHDAVDRGEKPVGYRADWMRDVSRRLAGFLAEEAAKFDRTHAFDKASVGDLLDILATTMNAFEEE